MGIPGNKWKQKDKREPTREVGAGPIVSPSVPYDAVLVKAIADQSRQLQMLLEQMGQDCIALGYGNWPGDRPTALATELQRHATLAVALQEAAAHRADGEAMRGLSRLQTVAALPDELDDSWLWLLEPEQRGLKDNYAALHRGLITDLGKQVGEILTSPATAVEQFRAEIPEIAQGTFIREAAYDAIVAEVHARADQARQRGNRGEADTLWQIVEEAIEPWVDPAVLQRQRGRWDRLRHLFSREEHRQQQPSSISQLHPQYSGQRVSKPPRRDSATGQREVDERVLQPIGSDAQAIPSTAQGQEEEKR